jgi:hypothetical protein
MSDSDEPDSVQPGAADPASAGNPSGQQQEDPKTDHAAKAGSSQSSSQNGDDDGVSDQVDKILAAGAPSLRTGAIAFGILAAGTAASYWTWRGLSPADFMPSSNYAVYAGLFVMAVAIERVLEPFSGWIAQRAAKTATAAGAAEVSHALAADSTSHGKAQAKAKAAQKVVHLSLPDRAVLMWAAASVLAMFACAALGIFLLRSVETPSATGGTSTSTSAQSQNSVPTGPTPAKSPNRPLDLLVTGLVVGAGTKPLHDLISQIQTSSGNSKASSSTPTTTSLPSPQKRTRQRNHGPFWINFDFNSRTGRIGLHVCGKAGGPPPRR